MVKVECLACGKSIRVPQYIDTDKYDGQLVCQQCKSILGIKLSKSKVQKYRIVNKQCPPIKLQFVPAEKLLREREDIVKD